MYIINNKTNYLVFDGKKTIVNENRKDKYYIGNCLDDILGNSCIKDAIRMMSGLDYGNMGQINEYLASKLSILRNAEKVVFEKVNL